MGLLYREHLPSHGFPRRRRGHLCPFLLCVLHLALRYAQDDTDGGRGPGHRVQLANLVKHPAPTWIHSNIHGDPASYAAAPSRGGYICRQ